MELRYGKNVSIEFIIKKLNWDENRVIIKTATKLAKHSTKKQNECYICKNKKTKKESTFYGIDYVRCLKCSHVFAKKKPTDEIMNRYYSKDKDYSHLAYANKNELKVRQDLIRSKIRYIKKYTEGKKWLDVGSADGASIVEICNAGFEGMGIEISESSRKFALKYRNIELYPKPLHVFAKEDKMKWDVISFFGVLEHLPNPLEALKISHKLLSKNGIIAIAVPNYDSLSTYIQRLIHKPDRHLIPYSHSMMFTQKSLTFAFNKIGFKPISIWWWGMDVIELLKYINKNNKNFANSKLQKTLIKNLNQIQHVFDRNCLGDEFMMLGKKIIKKGN